jgi:hypothetical protein
MTALGTVAGGPVAALGFGTTATGPATSATAETARIEPSVWLVEIATTGTTVAVSDRGWIKEPTDTAAITKYPPRLLEPPAIELAVPIYPSSARRVAVQAGELRIANGDGGVDTLGGNWTIAGRTATIYRAPHRRPTHALRSTWETVATLRTAAAFGGTQALRMPLRSGAPDLDEAVCETYTGAGGAEGDPQLAGINKPRLFGLVRNIAPVQVEAGRLIYQIHDGATAEILAVRDAGVPLVAGGDVVNYAALQSATVTLGTYKTCLATGHIRVGGVPVQLTADARGSIVFGGYAATASAVAAQIIRRYTSSTVTAASFGAWRAAEAGVYLRGGTVAQALDRLAAGLGTAWWGTDVTGEWIGGTIIAPETLGTGLAIVPAALAQPPEEIPSAAPPWWQAKVGFQRLDLVQSGAELAGTVSAEDRAYYSRQQRTAAAIDRTVRTAYPLAVEGDEVPGVLDSAGEAAAVAAELLALFKVPRRAWTVRLGPNAGPLRWWNLSIGAPVRLTWPYVAALADGTTLLVRSISARGDAAELELWG